MNIVDSSGWLEFFSGGANANKFEEPLSDVENLLVPSITIYEVFKVILREKNENSALKGIAAMKQGQVIDLSAEIAMSGAVISLYNKIPMADSIIWATAKKFDATVWTQDSDFKNMPKVKYFRK
ncbi:type II toxin-antitoxin system VapC family toxin [bacterium]|nr:type II toxin-antitoxin system VapC family toxin [bacterium]